MTESTERGSELASTTPAEPIATSVPAPIAIPTSACARAGGTLTPSPTADRSPIYRCSRVTSPASTSSFMWCEALRETPPRCSVEKLREQRFNACLDLVADGSHRIDTLPCRILEFPILVPLAGEERACVTAAHSDYGIRRLHRFGREDLRLLSGDVDADLAHRFNCDRVNHFRGHRTRRTYLDAVAGEFAQPTGRHLRAPGVVHADEEY